MNGPRVITISMVISAVCAELSIDMTELSGKTRHPRVVLGREVISFIGREATTCSYPEIARAVGRPNHSTIITAFDRINERMSCYGDPDVSDERDAETFRRVNNVRIALNLPSAVLPAPAGGETQ